MVYSAGDVKRLMGFLRELDSVVVVSHERPDPDALGSSLAMCFFLDALGCRDVTCVNATGVASKFVKLPGAERIKTQLDSLNPRPIIYLDCANVDRVGKSLAASLAEFQPVVNIDHHISNDRFGGYRLIDEKASSTCEIIGRLVQAAGVPWSAAMATNLLAGIAGDTGSFRYSQTKPETFEMAASLLRGGAEFDFVMNEVFASVSRATFLFQNKILSAVEFSGDAKIAGVLVAQADVEGFGVDEEATEGMVERLRDIQGVEVSYILRETAEGWRVSLRSRSERFDVSAVAAVFGGGGHKCAAAFRISGVGGVDLRTRLESELRQLCTAV